MNNYLTNPFGRKNGVLITIHDLDKETERGLKCGCECPNCKAPFEARMGEERIWHFAHSGTPCNQTVSFVNCIYEMTYDAITSVSRIVLPPLFGRYNCYSDYPENWCAVYDSIKRDGYEVVFPVEEYTVTKAEYEKDGNGMTKAILLNDGDLALKVTAQKEYCLPENINTYKDYPTIVIDLKDFVDKYNKTGLYRLIVENIRIKEWLKWKSTEAWVDVKRKDAYSLLELRMQQKAEEARKRKEDAEKREAERLALLKQKEEEAEKAQIIADQQKEQRRNDQISLFFEKRPKTESVFKLFKESKRISGRLFSMQGNQFLRKFKFDTEIIDVKVETEKNYITVFGEKNQKGHFYVLELPEDKEGCIRMGGLYTNFDLKSVSISDIREYIINQGFVIE